MSKSFNTLDEYLFYRVNIELVISSAAYKDVVGKIKEFYMILVKYFKHDMFLLSRCQQQIVA